MKLQNILFIVALACMLPVGLSASERALKRRVMKVDNQEVFNHLYQYKTRQLIDRAGWSVISAVFCAGVSYAAEASAPFTVGAGLSGGVCAGYLTKRLHDATPKHVYFYAEEFKKKHNLDNKDYDYLVQNYTQYEKVAQAVRQRSPWLSRLFS